MASKAPPIPPEQRASPRDKPHVEGPHGSGRERDSHLREQARSGGIHQNTHHQGFQGER